MIAENVNAEPNLAQVRSARITSLGTIPLVVLARGRPDPFPPQLNIPQETIEEAERVWQILQRELSKLSPRGKLSIAPQSGHYVQLDQPDLVVNAIRELVEAAAQ